MLHSEVFVFAGIAGSAVLFWAAKDFIMPKKKKKKVKKEKQTIVLDTIAVIWSKRKEAVLNIEELSLLWRSIRSNFEQNVEEIKFYSELIEKFYKENIEGKLFFTGNNKKVILNLLTLLDIEGNVSSVVSGQQDTESKIPPETFKKLYGVSLIEHTLNVAEEIMQIIPYGPMIPKGIIAALGHDIGKIPKYRQQYYALGDHPFISVNVLEQLPDFKSLVFADDVLKAIRDHHLKPKDKLTEYLKEADQRARRKELAKANNEILTEEIIGQTGDTHVHEEHEDLEKANNEDLISNAKISNFLSNEQTFYQTSSQSTKPQLNQTYQTYQTESEDVSNKIKTDESKNGRNNDRKSDAFGFSEYLSSSNGNLSDNSALHGVEDKEIGEIPEMFLTHSEDRGTYKYERKLKEERQDNIFISSDGNVEEKRHDLSSDKDKSRPKRLPLEWLNLDEFLRRIRAKINQIDDKQSWQAFSMPNGVVYVLPNCIFKTLKEMADELGVLDLDMVSKDTSLKKDYVYSILCRVKEEKNGIETSLIKEGYFSAPFIVKLKDGTILSRTLYVPFRAQEAFGKQVGNFEVIKRGRLLDIEEVVVPSAEKEKQF